MSLSLLRRSACRIIAVEVGETALSLVASRRMSLPTLLITHAPILVLLAAFLLLSLINRHWRPRRLYVISVNVSRPSLKRETDLYKLAERIKALLAIGLLPQLLGTEVEPGGVPMVAQRSVWRAVVLIGPFILRGVKLGDSVVSVERKQSWGELP